MLRSSFNRYIHCDHQERSGLVEELITKCDNFVRGCGDSVKFELEAHVARCKFSKEQCSNEGCEVIFNRKDQPIHEMIERM